MKVLINMRETKIGWNRGTRFSGYYIFFIINIMSVETEKITLKVEEIVKEDIKKKEEEIQEVKKTVADMEAKKKKAAEEAEKKEEEKKKEEEEKKKEEEEEEEKQAKLQKKEEEVMEAKMRKWLLEEEKGEAELRQLLNQHPEQFQNVDPYFFSNTLENMQQTIATQRALKRIRIEDSKQKAAEQRMRSFRKNNNPFGMNLF
jgi:nucleoid-associated protein YgaU